MKIYLARNNEQAGPYTLGELNNMLASGQVQQSDLIWHAGMPEWQTIGELTGGEPYYKGPASMSNAQANSGNQPQDTAEDSNASEASQSQTNQSQASQTKQVNHDSVEDVTQSLADKFSDNADKQATPNKKSSFAEKKEALQKELADIKKKQAKLAKSEPKDAELTGKITKTKRITALMLDVAIMLACFYPMLQYVNVINEVQQKHMVKYIEQGISMSAAMTNASNELVTLVPGSATALFGMLFLGFTFLQIFLLAVKGQTVGKAVVGIRIVSTQTLKKAPAFDIIFKRTAVIALLLFFVGHFTVILIIMLIAFNNRNHLFYERWSKTTLYYANDEQLQK